MQGLWILNLIYTVFNPIIKKSQSGIWALNLDIMFWMLEKTFIVTCMYKLIKLYFRGISNFLNSFLKDFYFKVLYLDVFCLVRVEESQEYKGWVTENERDRESDIVR